MSDLQPVAYHGRVFAAKAVRLLMRREADRFRFRETGGVLFGYRSGNDIVITEATGPGPDARHRRGSFEPDHSFCQSRLTAVYQSTGGLISYLGEWHTHPCATMMPSCQDLCSMLALANDPDVRQPKPLLCIYRRADKVLAWQWSENASIFLIDTVTKVWQSASIKWDEDVPKVDVL